MRELKSIEQTQKVNFQVMINPELKKQIKNIVLIMAALMNKCLLKNYIFFD